LLLVATFVYKDTFNLGYPGDDMQSRNKEDLNILTYPRTARAPGSLLLVYYIIGEWIPSLALLIIQSSLPSNLVVQSINSYGELERLIRQMKKDSPGEETMDKLLCKICLEREIDTALLPCRHSCLCSVCANNVNQCPVCRNSIGQVLQIYRS